MTERRPALTARLSGFGTTIFAEMSRLAAEHGAVNLGQGFPNFQGPDFIADAAVRAIREGRNQYARMQGQLELTTAIADGLRDRYGLEYDPATEITVTSGATEGIHCAVMALAEAGDEVVMLEPYYDSYRACCSLADAVPRFVTLHAPDFTWRKEELEAAFSERTRLLLLNTPHNPTGRVLTRPEMEQLAELCIRHDVLCVTDEVYDRLVFTGEHVPMATLPGMRERTVTLNSTGKTFSFTGWKIGYASGPADLAGAVAKAHQFVTFAVATPFQHAMAEALRAPPSYHEAFLTEYRERRDFLVSGLADVGFDVRPPEGTYFVMADFRPFGFDDDVAFCRFLVEEIGVAAIPPTSFYENRAAGRFLVRFAFCKTMDVLAAAVERLGKLTGRV